MKYFYLIIIYSIIATVVMGQEQVHWNYTCEKKRNKIFELHLTATISSPWHIYAQKQPIDAIAIPTQITFNKNPMVTVTGKMKVVGKLEKQKVEVLGIEQNMYEEKVEFVQTIEVRGEVKTNISGSIMYQACTDEQCLPPQTVSFEMPLRSF